MRKWLSVVAGLVMVAGSAGAQSTVTSTGQTTLHIVPPPEVASEMVFLSFVFADSLQQGSTLPLGWEKETVFTLSTPTLPAHVYWDDPAYGGDSFTHFHSGKSTFYAGTFNGAATVPITWTLTLTGTPEAVNAWVFNATPAEYSVYDGGSPVTARTTVSFDGPSFTATPEPASLALLGTGLVGVVPFARRRKRLTPNQLRLARLREHVIAPIYQRLNQSIPKAC